MKDLRVFFNIKLIFILMKETLLYTRLGAPLSSDVLKLI